jgi:hypothetical protein
MKSKHIPHELLEDSPPIIFVNLSGLLLSSMVDDFELLPITVAGFFFFLSSLISERDFLFIVLLVKSE